MTVVRRLKKLLKACSFLNKTNSYFECTEQLVIWKNLHLSRLQLFYCWSVNNDFVMMTAQNHNYCYCYYLPKLPVLQAVPDK